MRMKLRTSLLLISALIVSVSIFNPTYAQPTNASYTVNLAWTTLQLTYPTEVMPGSTVIVNVHVNPTSNGIYLQSLIATVYYADVSGLHQIATQNLITNPGMSYYYASESFNNSFQVNLPQNVPRTTLVAMFSEITQSYYYSSYWGRSWGCFDPIFCASPSYRSTDDAIAPLSYVEATTPEYVTLQSEYQALQQKLNQTQIQNQQLQNMVSQQSEVINQLNQHASLANNTTQTYQLLSLILAILVVALVAFNINQRRDREKTVVREEMNEEPMAKED